MSQTAIDTNEPIRPTTATDGANTRSVEPTEAGGSTTAAGLSKNTLFEILKNRRRREALAYLKLNGGTAKLGEMAEYIAARENGVELGALSSKQRKRVYIGLYQCHLPKMATAGVVDFDKNRGDIALRPEASQLDVYLEDGAGTTAGRRTHAGRDLVIAGGLGASVVASIAGVPGFVLVPDVAWALLSVGTLAALTALEANRPAPRA
ncbi:DUF7344 domain-containing protein [Salinigranum marinum]|uniref:DUF7344 domain-containing protein n=1 Tax=Salinigranum marinum TaxID=1515595 RepID=UPI002989CE5E|nr:hypothetical protein [Salinigranum marinum]